MKINVGHWVAKWASLKPEKPAIIFENKVFSYKFLNERVNRAAHMFQQMNITRNDRVGVLMHNTYQLVEIFFALSKIGAIFVPLNTRLSSAELNYIVNDSRTKCLIFDEKFIGTLEPCIKDFPVEEECFLCLGKPPKWAKSYEDEITFQKIDEPLEKGCAGGEDPLSILYTSGTTGVPKGAVLSHRKTFFNSLNANIYYGLRSSDIMLAPRPMFHSGGVFVELCPIIYAGGTLITQKRFDPEEILLTIEKYRATVLEIPATTLRFILEQCDISKYDLSSLRICYTGGEQVAPELLDSYIKAGIVVSQIYGQTETSTLTWLAPEDAIRKVGSIGKPVFHGNVMIIDKNGQETKPEEIGEIVASGCILMNGYWGNPELTEDTIIDGLLYTGDLAKRDEEGFYFIVGRKKDVYISGGENVYPAEVERVLLENQKILNVGVCGIPHEKWGETGLACIVLKTGEHMTEEEIIDFCEGRLARYKIPKIIEFVKALPINAAQKIDRKKLKNDYMLNRIE